MKFTKEWRAEMRMLEAKATPGDWRHVDAANQSIWCQPSDSDIDLEIALVDLHDDVRDHRSSAETKANAALIVAARNAFIPLIQAEEARGAENTVLRAALKDQIDLVERLINTLGESVQKDIRRNNAALCARLGIER